MSSADRKIEDECNPSKPDNQKVEDGCNPPEDKKFENEGESATRKICLRPPARIQTLRETAMKAIHMNDMDRLISILRQSTLLHDTGYELVSFAARTNNFKAMRLLAEYGCPVIRPGPLPYFIPSPMIYAIKHRNVEMVRFILSNAAPFSEQETLENEPKVPSRPNSR